MKILFFILSIFLLSACSQLQFILSSDKANSQRTAANTKERLHRGCNYYPYDNSDTPCNLFGWQAFVYQSLSQTQEEHHAALLSLGTSQGDKYKQFILLADHYESDAVRTQAIDAIYDISSENNNSFGYFFNIIATLQKHELLNKKKAADLQTELTKSSQQNSALKAQLADTQAKIQAIMEIEENLKTN